MKGNIFAMKSPPSRFLVLIVIESSIKVKIKASMSEVICEKNPTRNNYIQSNKLSISSKLICKN